MAIESTRGEGTTVVVTLPRECRQDGGPVPVVPIRTRARAPLAGGVLVPPAAATGIVAIRRPMGLFEASPENIRESYVPLRRAG